jgi:hypothetical protein
MHRFGLGLVRSSKDRRQGLTPLCLRVAWLFFYQDRSSCCEIVDQAAVCARVFCFAFVNVSVVFLSFRIKGSSFPCSPRVLLVVSLSHTWGVR